MLATVFYKRAMSILTGLKEHFTSEMLGLDIGNPELFNRHASSEHMVKVGIIAFYFSFCHGFVLLLGNSLCRAVPQLFAVLPQ